MAENIDRDELTEDSLLGEIITAAMLKKAEDVVGDEPALYQVPGWENIQDVQQLSVHVTINGIEVSLLDAIRSVDIDLHDRAESFVKASSYARAETFLETLDTIREDLLRRLSEELRVETEDRSVPTANEILSRPALSKLLSGPIPKLLGAARKWGDHSTVQSLEEVSQQLTALFSGESN